MLRRLLALAFGMVLGLALAEIAARAYVRFRLDDRDRAALVLPFERLPYRPHPYVNWEYKPGATCRNGETINAQGFRGPERPIPKPAGTYRIACIGASTTFTQSVAENETYPAQLELRLRRAHRDRVIEVLNAGVQGYTSAESVMSLALKVLDYQPDCIVVYEGVNDFFCRTYPGMRDDYFHCRVPWIEEDVQRTPAMAVLESLAVYTLPRLLHSDYRSRNDLYYWVYPHGSKRLNLDQALATSTTGPFRKNLEAMASICAARGIAVVLATMAQSTSPIFGNKPDPRALDDHNKAVRAVASDLGLTLAEVAEGFPQRDTFQQGDQVHMTAAGAAMLAERVKTAIERDGLLDRAAPAPALSVDSRADAVELPSAAPPVGFDACAWLEPQPYLLYRARPGCPADARGLGPHDALGLRGDAYDARRTDARRMLCLGGASTYGLGVAAGEAWPGALQRICRERGLDRMQVLNAGVPGHTTAESIAALHFRWRALAPEVVIIGHDVEDLAALALHGGADFHADFSHARRPWRCGERDGDPFERWTAPVREPGDDSIGCGAPPFALQPGSARRDDGRTQKPSVYAIYRNLRTLIALARSLRADARAIVLLADCAPGPFARAAALYNEAARLAAGETGALLVEPPAGATESSFLPGGWLPRAERHRQRAEAIVAQLFPG